MARHAPSRSVCCLVDGATIARSGTGCHCVARLILDGTVTLEPVSADFKGRPRSPNQRVRPSRWLTRQQLPTGTFRLRSADDPTQQQQTLTLNQRAASGQLGRNHRVGGRTRSAIAAKVHPSRVPRSGSPSELATGDQRGNRGAAVPGSSAAAACLGAPAVWLQPSRGRVRGRRRRYGGIGCRAHSIPLFAQSYLQPLPETSNREYLEMSTLRTDNTRQ
jgi:hypothetical protein